MNKLSSFGHAAVVAGVALLGHYLGMREGIECLSLIAAGLGALGFYLREVFQFKKKHGRAEWNPKYWNPQFQFDAGLPALVFIGVCIAYAARSVL